MPDRPLSRRTVLAGMTAVGSTVALSAAQAAAAESSDDPNWKITRGRIQQSVVHWCFKPMSVDDLARHAAALGMKSVELVPPADWPTLKKHGLTCAIASSHGFVSGWNDPANWDFCTEKITAAIDAAAEFGCPSVITFSGMRGACPRATKGTKSASETLSRGSNGSCRWPRRSKVTLALEMLNSRVDVEMKGHPGYQCDSIEWAVDVCNRVGSPRSRSCSTSTTCRSCRAT